MEVLALWLGPAFLVGVLVGFLVGRGCEGNRWMDNAEDYRRIEWRGKIYKVQHAGHWPGHKE